MSVGGLTLGISQMSAHFHSTDTATAKHRADGRSEDGGIMCISSGPTALYAFTRDIGLATSLTMMT